MAQRVRVIKAGGTGYSVDDVPMLKRVEGTPKEPGLAVKMGFMTIRDIAENRTNRFQKEEKLR